MIEAQSKGPQTAWTDQRLAEACLQGSAEAWSALIEKYKNLIFSIPVKYGFPRDDATEIFQQVCVELLTELPNLKNPQGLAKWLIQVTAHRCYHWKRSQGRFVSLEEELLPETVTSPELPEELLHQVETEQKLRDELAALTPRCRQLIEMLFFEQPARSYNEVATSLGLATGSIGFIRGRCLGKLRARLEKAGFA